jgi:hypothetical protein
MTSRPSGETDQTEYLQAIEWAVLLCPSRVNNGPDGPETRLLLYPINGHRQTAPACLKGADIVAKVENRITLEISRKLIFGRLCGCVAFSTPLGRSLVDFG